MSSNWESLLTPQEIQAYGQFFSAANGGKSNVVNGQDAVDFFARSGIPNEILSDIWETADRDNLGYLTAETFSIALKLIACAQHGHEVAEPILSTVVSLPQFKGFNPDTTASPISSKDVISTEEREKYLAIFRAHQPVQGTLDAEKARNIFSKSKLPNEYLAQIWNLADVRKSGNLNQTEFVIAMHYVARLMDRSITTLPSQLPAKIYGSAAGSIQSSPVLRRTSVVPASMTSHQSTGGSFASPAPRVQRVREESIESLGSMAFSSGSTSNWDVTPQEKSQFDMFFDQIDTKRVGAIQGNEAVSFFKNSRLPDSELARVWDLADIEQNGQLTRDEFAVAMHLIQNRLTGKPLPNVLPKSLIPPSAVTSSVPVTPSTPQHVFQSPPSMVQPSQPLHPPEFTAPSPPQEDLLGDFGDNEELTTVTNAVNQLQYQISNVQSSTAQVTSQKASMATSLDQARKQKDDVQRQTAQIADVQQAENQRLAELQSLIKTEEPGWINVRKEHEAAQQQLDEAKKQLSELNQTLAQGRTDSEQLRQRVHQVQEETANLVNQLERLRVYVNKTAAPAADTVVTSTVSPGLSFDDIFTPPASTPQPATVTPTVEEDFDAIFAPHPPVATAKRQPPPPPPPSRRTTIRRQETPQAAKKTRAPPPPPPSVAATATTATAAMVAGATAAAVAHDAEETESDTTASSDTESSLDDASRPATEAPVQESIADITRSEADAPTVDSATKSEIEQSSEHAAKKELDASTVEINEEPEAKKIITDVPATVTTSATVEEDQPSDNATISTSEPISVTAIEENRQESPSKDSTISAELPSDTTDAAKAKSHKPLEDTTDATSITPDAKTEEAPKESSPEDITTSAGISSGITESVEEINDHSLDHTSRDMAAVNESEEPTESAESPSSQPSSHAKETVALEVNPPKEEERVTSEILADKVTPESVEAPSSDPAASQVLAEKVSENSQDKDEIEPLENPEKTTIDAPVASQNDTIASELPAGGSVANPVPESISNEILSSDASIAAQESLAALPEQKESVASDLENKVDDPVASSGKNVAKEEMTRGDSADVGDTITQNLDDDISTVSPKEDTEPAYNVSGSQGHPEVQAATIGIEEKALEIDKFKDTQEVEQATDTTDREKELKEKESESDIDEFLSVDGDDVYDQVQDQEPKSDSSLDASKTDMQDLKEEKPMDEQTEPTNSEGGEARFPAINEERAEAASVTAKEERDSRGTLNDANDDSAGSKQGDPHEREDTSHNQAPSDVVDSDLIMREPVEYVRQEVGPVMHKEPEKSLSSHDKAKEEQAKEQSANDDFDAVLMEKPGDKDRSSSDEGGGESFEIISSTASPKEQEQAPAIDEFDSAFASELEDARVVNNPAFFNQEDFDAAFSEELTDARVVQNSDEKELTQRDNKLSWASNFGGFSFDFDTKKKDDDWDSIFGGDDGKAGDPEHVGFEDAFSASFNNSNSSSNDNSQSVPATERNVKEVQQGKGTVANSTLDELVMMGFDRDLAKDALQRYDQDLQKATNFLLDLS